MVASPIYNNDIIYVATITGRIFAANISEKKVKWHSNITSPIVSSPLFHKGMLISATFDSWIKDTVFLGKNLVFALVTDRGDQLWSLEINGDVFSSPCVAKDTIQFYNYILIQLNKIVDLTPNPGDVRCSAKNR